MMQPNLRFPDQIVSALRDKQNVDQNIEFNNSQKRSSNPRFPVNRLLIVVLPTQNVRKILNDLKLQGVWFSQIPSTGAFLGLANITLLIALEENQVSDIVDLISRQCVQRIEYVAVPMEGAPLPVPVATPITLGGATILTLEIEHFEEF